MQTFENQRTIEKILKNEGDWAFDRETSNIFDMHVRRSVPCYEDFHNVIGLISKDLLTDDSMVYDLGTSTGQCILTVSNANPDKKLSFVGIDNSEFMINRAKERCVHISNVEFISGDIESLEIKKPNLVTSLFTLQFIKTEQRKKVFEKICNSLKDNKGYFILCEKIIGDDLFLDRLLINMHENWKFAYFTKEEILSKKNSLKNVMFPISLNDNFQLLHDAGFSNASILFKWGNFVCILAY